LDVIHRQLLDRIQRSFPVVPRPYGVLSESLGIGEPEVRERLASLKDQRLIRQISAIFNTGSLGYRTSLVAMAVPESALEPAVTIINAYPGVSHNYLRLGEFNVWFTIAVPPGKELPEVVEGLTRASGGWPTLILPALRKYKLAVVLDVLEEGEADSSEGRVDHPRTESSTAFQPSEKNIQLVRCVQEDLPLVEEPFAHWGQTLGITENELLGTLEGWLQHGHIRRFAAVLNHREVGFNANGMVVWRCPLDKIDESGSLIASYSEVSHCYHRPARADWPYNLYAMIHGRSEDECEKIAARLAEAIDLREYRILFSLREFKKIRLKLFWDECRKP
jgi:siroheme decarboxylase